jgi:large subunit ribosomal protein L4
MELKVLNIDGKETGKTVVLNDAVFGIEPNDHAIYLDVKQYLANLRQGTHKAKTRNEIAGSTRKLLRQKGTGGARHGDIKAPIFVGGGRVFGPVPRSYSFKLNKKVKALARKSALTYKVQNNALVVVEDFALTAPKTKSFVSFLKNINASEVKTLFVMPEVNENIFLSARNLPKAKVITLSEVNTYKVLDAKCMVVTESALAAINNF